RGFPSLSGGDGLLDPLRFHDVEAAVQLVADCLEAGLGDVGLDLAEELRQVVPGPADAGGDVPDMVLELDRPAPARPDVRTELVDTGVGGDLETDDVAQAQRGVFHDPRVPGRPTASLDPGGSIGVVARQWVASGCPRATATASSRECAPTAWSRWRMWLRTVSRLRCRSSAICAVVRPRSSSRRTSAWRGVRRRSGWGCGSSTRSDTWPKTPITWSPRVSGTELISTGTRRPCSSTSTSGLSAGSVLPSILRAKCSRARRVSSWATTDVNWRPSTSPTSRRPASLTQRMIPVVSIR